MGQSVVALMYGISNRTEGLRDERGESFWAYGSPKEKRYDQDGPRDAYEGEAVGYPVACSGGMDDDEDYLGESCRLSQLEQVHSAAIIRARVKWEAFAKWALETHGMALPPAELWITQDERA